MCVFYNKKTEQSTVSKTQPIRQIIILILQYYYDPIVSLFHRNTLFRKICPSYMNKNCDVKTMQ